MLPAARRGQDACPGLASRRCLSSPPFSVMLFNLLLEKAQMVDFNTQQG